MKIAGVIALIIGTIGFLVCLSMDTSVATDDVGRRINNIGLMNDKQNLLLLFAVVSIIGAIFLALGERSQGSGSSLVGVGRIDSSQERKCPFCAEQIKAEAVICRYCQKDIPPTTSRVAIDKPAASECLKTLVSCGYLVTRPTEGTWKIVHPLGKTELWAYSVDELQSLTQRIMHKRAL